MPSCKDLPGPGHYLHPGLQGAAQKRLLTSPVLGSGVPKGHKEAKVGALSSHFADRLAGSFDKRWCSHE